MPLHKPAAPWVMRTYAGHSNAAQSNALFLANLAKGQTGLSVAFDLPTQTGYDSTDAEARYEVGKTGVPIADLHDMRTLFAGIDLAKADTSMTINAPAMWLLALYITLAQEQDAPLATLRGTVQNDILKEYIARGTYIFPPEASLRLASEVVAYTAQHMPKWNPINVCSYHLQEAGADPTLEAALVLTNACTMLDAVRQQPAMTPALFEQAVGRVSFFLNSSVRFIGEICKMRALTNLWQHITAQRYGITNPLLQRFRYGMQVNSLDLTEQQPENNIPRMVLSMLGGVLSADARARAVQLPAWSEALGLPLPQDQQRSLRLQQVAAYESDILAYGDIFAGSQVIEAETAQLQHNIWQLHEELMQRGAAASIHDGTFKTLLMQAQAKHLAGRETHDRAVVGVNCFTQTIAGDEDFTRAIERPNPQAEAARVQALTQRKAARDAAAIEQALTQLRTAAQTPHAPLMPATLQCARVGVTTGEWGQTLRDVFGLYRPPLPQQVATPNCPNIDAAHAQVQRFIARYHTPPRLLIAKPGLDGHSNGAEQVALRARACGIEVIYEGIRHSVASIMQRMREVQPHMVALSVLSGSHMALTNDVLQHMRQHNLQHIPLVLGGIIPPEDAAHLRQSGVRAVYTPKNYDLNAIIGDMLDIMLG